MASRRGERSPRAPSERRARILVIAGVNGAGKSSVAGAAIREAGGVYYNPDEATQRLLVANPGATLEAANAEAWDLGRRQLERAIREKLDYTFETTLGGSTITRLLERAVDTGLEVSVRYVGLEGPELHIARVRERVAAGGHHIPEDRVRARYDTSRRNLIRLLPRLTELELFDNSREANPRAGEAPEPKPLLHIARGAVIETAPLHEIPSWARPIVMAALRRERSSRKRR